MNKTINDLQKLQIQDYVKNPVIKVPPANFRRMVYSDCTITSKTESSDGQLHLFCHSLESIHHFISEDGIRWKELNPVFNTMIKFDQHKWLWKDFGLAKTIQTVAASFKTGIQIESVLRPQVFRDEGKYKMVFQKFFVNFRPNAQTQFTSDLYLCESNDLQTWTSPKLLLASTEDFPNLSSPFILQKNGGYFLFFSYGLTFLHDTAFQEPVHLGWIWTKSLAKISKLNKLNLGFPMSNSDIISQGCFKAKKIKGGYLGYTNVVTQKKGELIKSEIYMFSSKDCINWDYCKKLLGINDLTWKPHAIYVLDLIENDGLISGYYNARISHPLSKYLAVSNPNSARDFLRILFSNMFLSREHIGVFFMS